MFEAGKLEESSLSADASTESPAVELYRWIRAYEERLNVLADELGERWVSQRFGRPLLDVWRFSERRVRWQLVLAMLGSEHPSANGLKNPANRLALLPTEQLHWVLRARALYAKAAAMRRCVDGQLIDRVAAALGPDGANVVRHLSGLFEWEQDDDLTPFLQTSSLDWSLQGLMCFAQDGVWNDRTLEAMIRMSLPTDRFALKQIRTGGAAQSLAFLRCVPTLYPDMSWLFG